ncbi:MAG TPA: hypothetical protein VLS91_01500 [Acidimicrobiales bacterium]|nr:hypothetical protein [Acidimicrobiales bacterium]
MAVIDAPEHESASQPSEELLIREARLRARRRRSVIVLALIVVVAAIIVVTGGGGHHPVAQDAPQSPASAPGAVGGNHAAAAPQIPGGQLVQSVTPVGGQTLWVSTSNPAGGVHSGQGIEWTSNGGRTWRDVTPTGMGRVTASSSIAQLGALSATRAWIEVGPEVPAGEGLRRTLWVTSDAGRHWNYVGVLPFQACQVLFWNPADGVCTQTWGASNQAPLELAATFDGGRMWTVTFDNTKGFGGTDAGDLGLPFGCDKEFSVTSPHTLWARFWCNSSQAILYRSGDSGRTWSPVTVAQPQPTSPGGMAFPGNIVMNGRRGATPAVVGENTIIFFTSDGGQSFSPVYPPGPPRAWVADVVTPEIWRLAWHHQIIGTNDAGKSWFGVSNSAFTAKALRSLWVRKYAPKSPGQVTFLSNHFGWATWGLPNGQALLVTNNGGQSWRQVAVPGTAAVSASTK